MRKEEENSNQPLDIDLVEKNQPTPRQRNKHFISQGRLMGVKGKRFPPLPSSSH